MKFIDFVGLPLVVGSTVAASVMEGRHARMRKGTIISFNEEAGTVAIDWVTRTEEGIFLSLVSTSVIRRSEVHTHRDGSKSWRMESLALL